MPKLGELGDDKSAELCFNISKLGKHFCFTPPPKTGTKNATGWLAGSGQYSQIFGIDRLTDVVCYLLAHYRLEATLTPHERGFFFAGDGIAAGNDWPFSGRPKFRYS